MILENIVKSKETNHKRLHTVWLPLYKISSIGKSKETGNRCLLEAEVQDGGEGKIIIVKWNKVLCFLRWLSVLELMMLLLHLSVNIPKTIELHSLNEWIVWYMNYILVKSVKNTKFGIRNYFRNANTHNWTIRNTVILFLLNCESKMTYNSTINIICYLLIADY